jgi:TPR repeat protein
LGDIYSFGSLDLEKDDVEGHKWYLMAAEQNTTEGCCLWSTKIIGDNYYYGSGVTRDIEEAVRWYRRAAYAGWTRSQLELGVMLRDGINVRQDYTEAVMLFRAAAESGKNGDPNGKLYLGEMYEQGKGVLQDYLEAVKWYQDSGSQGNYWAQKNLAHMYRDGLGVEQDLGEAYVWYSIAAVDEDEWQNFEATKQRDLIAKLLDPKSRNELQEKTKELYEFIETRRYHGLD